jgi:mono/diheme cytochrome c family protein
MKTLWKIVKFLLIIIVIAAGGIVTYALTSYEKKFDAPYPEITASTDSAVIARGRHLAMGPAHCADCHAPVSEIAKVLAGEEVPLSGGFNFVLPIGVLYVPNITSDQETGIGKLTDGEIARSLRYGIRRDGQAILDLMPFYDLSDEDLTAIISWLRTQPPVKSIKQDNSYNFLGKMVKTFAVKPAGDGDVPPAPPQDSTAAYGKYLVNSVANCRGCHTERDLMTGAFVGPELGGGFPMEVFNEKGEIIPGKHLITPNLTKDAATGIIANWTQEQFIQRFRTGVVIPGTPMPWGPFSRMTDLELKAIYKYLNTISPVSRKQPYGIQEGDPNI